MKIVTKIRYWVPRVLAILYICFVSVFALDVLGEPQWFLALFMHLIPSMVLLLVTLVAWNRARLGGVLFCLVGLCMMVLHRTVGIILPMFVIGLLFLTSRQ